jgi:hypothetical protein
VADYAPRAGIGPTVPLDAQGEREPRDGLVEAPEHNGRLSSDSVRSVAISGLLASRGTLPGT